MKETLCKLKEMFTQEAICPLLEHDGVKVAQVTQPFNRTFPCIPSGVSGVQAIERVQFKL